MSCNKLLNSQVKNPLFNNFFAVSRILRGTESLCAAGRGTLLCCRTDKVTAVKRLLLNDDEFADYHCDDLEGYC